MMVKSELPAGWFVVMSGTIWDKWDSLFRWFRCTWLISKVALCMYVLDSTLTGSGEPDKID